MTVQELRQALASLPDDMPVVLGWYYNGALGPVEFTSVQVLRILDDDKEALVLQESSL